MKGDWDRINRQQEGHKEPRRKPRPSAPDWYWYASDGCWDCPDHHGCSSCPMTKVFRHLYRKKKEQAKIRTEYSENEIRIEKENRERRTKV